MSSDYSKRLDKMTEVMFAGRCLRELKQAVQDLFDVFYDVITEPIVSYADLTSKLSTVSAKRWDKIRSSYIQDETLEYCNGASVDGQDNDGAINVVKILLDFITLMSKCSQEVMKKVEERQQELRDSDCRMNTMKEQIRKMEEVMESQKTFYTDKISENNDLSARNMHLQNQIADKNKQIADLERTNNTELWEREKKLLLKDSSETISTLEKEVKDLKLQIESGKHKIAGLEIQLKQHRLKSQVTQERSNSPSLENGEDKVKLSTINYMQDKDIIYLEKKLYDLQTSTVGVIGGIKTDFKQMAHKFIDPEQGNVDEQFQMLSKRMDRVYKAMANDDVEKAREWLPPHYRYIEDENFKVKKIRRLSQPIISAANRPPNSLDEKKPVLKPIPKIPENPINPVIINPETKKLHPINPMKYFPFMSQQFIKDQFEKFNRYDKNGNGSLDLQEMIDIVKEIGFDFNIHQLEEAMEEVDRDGNKSLDFFEYMLIIDNIYRKQGKAELFQQGMKEVRRNNMSKTCVVQ